MFMFLITTGRAKIGKKWLDCQIYLVIFFPKGNKLRVSGTGLCHCLESKSVFHSVFTGYIVHVLP